MNILVSNLSLNVIDSDLRKLFAEYGEVNSAVVIRDKLNGRSKGSAMVDMISDVQGQQAIISLDKKLVDGKAIKVSEMKYSLRDYKN